MPIWFKEYLQDLSDTDPENDDDLVAMRYAIEIEATVQQLEQQIRTLREALKELIFASKGLVSEAYLRDARAALKESE